MPHRITERLSRITGRLASVLMLLALTAGCTRQPYNPDRPEIPNEDMFTFNPVLQSATIWQVAVALSPDGHIAAAVATGYRELILLEESAGAWSTIATLSGGGLHPSSISIAPGPGGTWWVLAANTDVGQMLYRVGGAGDSSLVIPKYQQADYDSVSYAALASDDQGRPVAILQAIGEGLVRAALTDTGWVLSEIPQTGIYSTINDFAIDALGQEHLVYHISSGDDGQYRRVGLDTTITELITNSGEILALAVTSDGYPFVAGSVGQNNLLMWQLFDSETAGFYWVSETLSIMGEELYVGNFDLCLNPEVKPYIAFAIWRGPGRFNLNMATRPPQSGQIGYGWSLIPVVEDLARVGATNRMTVFKVVLDTDGTPHFFYLSGGSGETISSLWEAVPISQ